jgi:hypothetical protein
MAMSVGEQLDTAFIKFEGQSEWRLSLPAKVIIQQAVISIEMDNLGMGEYAGEPDRGNAVKIALSKLPDFLDLLKREAAKRPDTERGSKIIGGGRLSWRTPFISRTGHGFQFFLKLTFCPFGPGTNPRLPRDVFCAGELGKAVGRLTRHLGG